MTPKNGGPWSRSAERNVGRYFTEVVNSWKSSHSPGVTVTDGPPRHFLSCPPCPPAPPPPGRRRCDTWRKVKYGHRRRFNGRSRHPLMSSSHLRNASWRPWRCVPAGVCVCVWVRERVPLTTLSWRCPSECAVLLFGQEQRQMCHFIQDYFTTRHSCSFAWVLENYLK